MGSLTIFILISSIILLFDSVSQLRKLDKGEQRRAKGILKPLYQFINQNFLSLYSNSHSKQKDGKYDEKPKHSLSDAPTLVACFSLVLLIYTLVSFVINIAYNFLAIFVAGVTAFLLWCLLTYGVRRKFRDRENLANAFFLMLVTSIITLIALQLPILGWLLRFANDPYTGDPHAPELLGAYFLVAPWITCIFLTFLFRLSYQDSVSPICQECNRAKQKLSPDQLTHLLTKPQETAQEIGSMQYEAWYCSQCHPLPRHRDNITLFAKRNFIKHGDKGALLDGFKQTEIDAFQMMEGISPLDSKTPNPENSKMRKDKFFGYCQTCEEWTQVIKEDIIKPATYQETGEKQIHTHCFCCELDEIEEKEIPVKTHSHRSSSSSSSGYGSYGSYGGESGGSYSGDSGGGSSFGGGESGGGGDGGGF